MKFSIDTGFSHPEYIGPFVYEESKGYEPYTEAGIFSIGECPEPNDTLCLTISTWTTRHEHKVDFMKEKLQHWHSVKIGDNAIFEIHSTPSKRYGDMAIEVLGQLKGDKLIPSQEYFLSVYEFLWSDFQKAVNMANKIAKL